jgi:hypothetical protein
MSFQHCVALVITIRDYLHLKPLPLQVSRDGHDVVAALKNKDIGQYEPENIVHVTDPTRKEFLAVMKKRVKKLIKRGKSIFTVYLAAHCGKMGMMRRDFICCIDANGARANSAISGSVKLGWFVKKLVSFGAKKTVVFFDGWHQGRLQGVTRLHVRRAKRQGTESYSEIDKNTINACAYPVSHKLLKHVKLRLSLRQNLRCYGKKAKGGLPSVPRRQVCCMTSCRTPQTAHYGKPNDRNSHFGRHVVACLCGRSGVQTRSVLPEYLTAGAHLETAEDSIKEGNTTTGKLCWEDRGVHTKDIYNHVATKLDALSKILETEKEEREDVELGALVNDEAEKKKDFEEKYNKAKEKVKENEQQQKFQIKEVARIGDQRKEANAKAHELSVRAGEMAKLARTPEEYNTAAEADKEANKVTEQMHIFSRQEDEAKTALNVLRTKSKEDERVAEHVSNDLQDFLKSLEKTQKTRAKDLRKREKKRRFMLNKPWAQTIDYQLYPNTAEGFILSRWPKPPTTPRNACIVEEFPRSLSFTWDTSDFSGAIVDKYQTLIRGNQRANSEWKEVRNCDWLPNTYQVLFHSRTERHVKTTACNLATETNFQFKTRAHNPGGWGEFSNISGWGRTKSMTFCGQPATGISLLSIPETLEKTAKNEGVPGMIKILENNLYNIGKLEGPLRHLISVFESGESSALRYEGEESIAQRIIKSTLAILKNHKKSALLNRLSFRLLGRLCAIDNLIRRRIVHLGGSELAGAAEMNFGGHWKANVDTATMAFWARNQMKSHMSDLEASVIVQKYIRKLKAKKKVKAMRKAQELEELLAKAAS